MRSHDLHKVDWIGMREIYSIQPFDDDDDVSTFLIYIQLQYRPSSLTSIPIIHGSRFKGAFLVVVFGIASSSSLSYSIPSPISSFSSASGVWTTKLSGEDPPSESSTHKAFPAFKAGKTTYHQLNPVSPA